MLPVGRGGRTLGQPTKHVRTHTHKLKPLNHFTVDPQPLSPLRFNREHLLKPLRNTLRQGLPAQSPTHMAQGEWLQHDERRRVATPTSRRTNPRGLTGRVGSRRTHTVRARVQGIQVLIAVACTARRTSAASTGSRGSGALRAPTTIEGGGCLVHRVPPTWRRRRCWPTPVGVGVVAPPKPLSKTEFAVLEPLSTMDEAPSIELLPRRHPLTTDVNDRRPLINLIVEGEH